MKSFLADLDFNVKGSSTGSTQNEKNNTVRRRKGTLKPRGMKRERTQKAVKDDETPSLVIRNAVYQTIR